jgi:hypothetical protein
MDREKYRNCMSGAMSGKAFTPGERRQEFCVAAKLCSNKASSRDEAIEMCKNRPPKEPKERKPRGKRSPEQCDTRVLKLAHCVAEKIDMGQVSNVNSVELAVANALLKCECEV